MLYLIGGLNDLFMDLVFYCKPLRKWIAQGRVNPTVQAGELYDPARAGDRDPDSCVG